MNSCLLHWMLLLFDMGSTLIKGKKICCWRNKFFSLLPQKMFLISGHNTGFFFFFFFFFEK